jgi:hypothetical protein
MKSRVLFASFYLLFAVTVAAAPKYSRFHEHPLEKEQFVRRLEDRLKKKKGEALAWARANGRPVRYERNGRLHELMALDDGKPVYYVTFNYNAAISTAADQVRNSAPYNVDGNGTVVGVWDSGSVLETHQEFGSRVTLQDAGAGYSDHGTHVAGTIGAAGVELGRQGMAPAVFLDSYDWNADLAEMALAAATAPGQTNDLYLSNHSYGFTVNDEHLFGQYYYYCIDLDETAYNSQYYLPFVSAGNEQDGTATGYDTVSSFGVSKNAMTVGAVMDAVSGTTRSLVNATMTTFSSWGPVDDGRIKPDIVANGWQVYSSSSSGTNEYVAKSGTSMASPNACGSAALLVDYYDDCFPGQAMRASTLKGLIIHTSDDLGRPGPDYKFGWGLMNTLAATELIKDVADGNTLRMTEALLEFPQNTSDTYNLFSDGLQPLRVTLCWTDPPGTLQTVDDNRSSRLVNDLDLRITGPGGTYYPYKLDYANPSNNATTNSENNVDNVEQVYIAAPIAGEYVITVDYDGSLTDMEQHYSLLVSGISSDSDGDGMPDHWELIYFASPTGAVAGVDSDGDGVNNLGEYVSGHNPNDSNSVFRVAAFSVPVSNNTPFIIHWESVEGRIYNIDWSDDLLLTTFTNISGDRPYPANSYTDSVPRTAPQNFYRIGVRLPE